MTIIDPNGDIILTVGRDEEQFKVSSNVLRLASSVFAAMLKPHFLEGRQLQESGNVRIVLAEDDATAMKTVCEAMHHITNRFEAGNDDPKREVGRA